MLSLGHKTEVAQNKMNCGFVTRRNSVKGGLEGVKTSVDVGCFFKICFFLDVFFLGREQPISGSNAPIETSLKLSVVSSSKHGECLFRSYKPASLWALCFLSIRSGNSLTGIALTKI